MSRKMEIPLYEMSEDSCTYLAIVTTDEQAEIYCRDGEIECEVTHVLKAKCTQAFTNLEFERQIFITEIGMFVNEKGKAYPEGRTIFCPVTGQLASWASKNLINAQ